MNRKTWAAVMAIAATGMFAAFAGSASAYPTVTSPCTGCHSGANVPVTATVASSSGSNVTYNVSAPTATAIAVFDGSTKLFTFTATSGSFTVAAGKTYSIYAVKGPTTGDGIGSTSVTPVASPPADTTAPVTTSDVKATYVSSAVIKLTATDAVGVTATYFTIDGGVQTAGTTINVATAGSHTIQFWSVDAAGNVEVKKSATFTITVPDTTAPVTTSDAKATYVSSAVIKLTATDAGGVAHTYYILNGAAQVEGTTINLNAVGTYTLEFWSVDAAGNVEAHKTATFAIAAPDPVDTTAPVTTSDAKATYVSSATIKLTASDAVGVAHTYYRLDGATQVEGTSLTVTAVGSHTLVFWSVDAAGNIEAVNTVTFDVTALAPVPDTTAPKTTSDAKATYVGSATIHLTATDDVGVEGTYFVLDGAPQLDGTVVNATAVGSHTLTFWSEDAAGNIEASTTVTFDVTAPAPAPAVSVTINSSARSVREDHAVRLSGIVAPVDALGQLSLYVQKPGSTRWVLVSHPVVSATGAWTFSYTPRNHGTYRFQVRYVTADGTVVSRTITLSASRSDD